MSTPPNPQTQSLDAVPRWRIVGPGLVAAATGVGAGDLAATLVAGSRFGYTLLWAALVGALVKIALAEATGRWHLASGSTIFQGWWSIGRWAVAYFGIYVVVWGFSYGAAAMSSTALPLHAMFPEVPFNVLAIGSGLLGAALVLLNRYHTFEKIIAVLVGVMFVTVIGAAAVTAPNLGGILDGLVPRVPEGSLLQTLGLIGGVGGTITMAAYGYWINAKGWQSPRWMKVMRLDNSVAYALTGVFVIALLIMGAELLYSAGIAVEGQDGLVELGGVLEERYGAVLRWMFLIGFWAASFTSILGVWNGVSLLFADFAASVRARVKGEELADAETRESNRSPWFIAYVLWLTFPPMLLLLMFDQPVTLIILYGALGAAFMPFLALTLIWLLNSKRVAQEHRNGWVSNATLAVAGLLFLILCANELYSIATDYVSG